MNSKWVAKEVDKKERRGQAKMLVVGNCTLVLRIKSKQMFKMQPLESSY